AVFPTHRLVRDLDNYEHNAIITKSAEYFDITQNLSRSESLALSHQAWKDGNNAFVLYNGDNYTLMILKDKKIMDSLLSDSDVSLRSLDVSVLHSLVLERLFGIDKENMAAQTNLTYVKNTDEVIAAVDNGNGNCAFLLNSTRVSEIRDVSLAGGKMPQKSTYFYPKLTTGLVMNRIFKEEQV
ncbi:MAG: DUF1015 family protein, partial [Oscillospiraceae bacterium]|nr:DUF1015 family protein [Oscillospiraceae bacterium]